MSLKDKEIRWYRANKNKSKILVSYHDKPHIMSKDIKEAVLEFRKACNEPFENSEIRHMHIDRLNSLIKEIFGDWEK